MVRLPRVLPVSRWRGLCAVRVPAILAALMAVLNVWSAITPGVHARLQILWEVLPFQARQGSRLTAALAGFALLLLAQGLWRRKQVAWGLALGALLTSAIAHLLKGLDYEEASCALFLVVWLWMARQQFHARSDPPSMKRGLQVLALAFVFTLLYGTFGFYLLDRQFKVNFDTRAALSQTVTMFTQFYDPGLEPVTNRGRNFAASIYIVAAFTLGYALLMLARPMVQRRNATPEERKRAEEIVHAHGRNALAFCALFEDKSLWFSPGGSLVPYAVVGRIAVALGDPIGPLGDIPAAIRGFVNFCERNDWRAAWYEVYDEFLDVHRACGLQVLRIAHEAVVEVQKYSTEGKSNKNLRNALNGFAKIGVKAQLHQPPLSDVLMSELREVSDEWLAMMNGSEKQFSLGGFEDAYIRSCPVMAVHNTDGSILAFANIVSCYNLNESTIDLMRRRSEVPNGTMELLFVSLFDWSKKEGFDTFNLGPSPFAMVGEHSEDPATEKALHFIYEHINQFYNFKGLHAFKEKFRPQWRPLFLTYSGAAGLPSVAAAIIRADSGQDSWWDFLKHLRGDNSDNSRELQVAAASSTSGAVATTIATDASTSTAGTAASGDTGGASG